MIKLEKNLSEDPMAVICHGFTVHASDMQGALHISTAIPKNDKEENVKT